MLFLVSSVWESHTLAFMSGVRSVIAESGLGLSGRIRGWAGQLRPLGSTDPGPQPLTAWEVVCAHESVDNACAKAPAAMTETPRSISRLTKWRRLIRRCL